jgi:hypothetical protein
MKTTPEFDKFTGFMDRLAKVPHSEMKTALEEEKAEKWIERTRKEFVRKGGLEGAHIAKERGTNPVVQVANEVFQKAARRQVN